MGLATGPEGRIYITDLDTIEKSNLNRQFLFRPKDVGSFKSEAGRRAITEMNESLVGKVEVFKLAVGGETEGTLPSLSSSPLALRLLTSLQYSAATFGDSFFDGLDGVTNALDNVAAREFSFCPTRSL